MKLVGLLSLAFLSFSLSASPVFWDLVGVTFDDGGTATGSFAFDASTGLYSAINITTTHGSTLNGKSYDDFCTSPCTGVVPDASDVLFLTTASSNDLKTTHGFSLFLTNPLTDNSGGVVDTFNLGQEAPCKDSTCSAPTARSRIVDAGELESTPEPASILLMGVGAAMLAGMRLQRQRA